MRVIFGLVLIVGVALAGFAVHMTRGYLSTYQAELDREKALRAQIIATEELYVAAEPIQYGDVIAVEKVKKMRWPVEAMPEGAFFTEEELFPEGLETPRIALRTIEVHEPLMAVKVTEAGEDAGVASRLSKGMRAFAISVDVSTGVSGLLHPGDHVDVYWTGTPPGGKSRVTKLIQTTMKLVAIDQKSDSEARTSTIARTVTVEASPQQVAALATAQSSGRLSLALVGRGDDTVVSGVQVDQNSLLGIQEEAVVVAEKERVCTIRTRKGGEIIETPIACKD